MFWQVLLARSLYPRTQASGIASSTGSRRWWRLWQPWAPEGIHYCLWDGACPLPRQPALSFCRIPFTRGARLPARCLVWRVGWWATPSSAVSASCCKAQNSRREKKKKGEKAGKKKIQKYIQSNYTKLSKGEEVKRICQTSGAVSHRGQSTLPWLSSYTNPLIQFSKVSAKAIYTFSSTFMYPNTKSLCWCEKQNPYSR